MHSASTRVKGFTLIEMMVVVAIIAILAAIALPAYSDYVKRGYIADATRQLSAYRVSMEQYYQDARTYQTSGTFTTPCPANVAPANGNWTYNCPAASLSAAGYVITATGTGPVNGFQYSINQNNNQVTVTIPSSWGTNGTTHWIMRKGG
ncbi:MAG: prepilin-type N-terminal cleavage/methylation domain-containing protein [Proteobacteria bacterium]|nr:prepilin-type N-terminal cleavage/methylation domain-containing protein [Pseudomonadota bacterium]